MAKQKRRGYGTVVEVDIAGNGTFVVVGFVRSITPPDFEVEDVMGETLDDDREQPSPGITKAVAASFKQFTDQEDATDQTGSELDVLARSKAVVDWRYTYPGGAIDTFPAYIQSIKNDETDTKSLFSRTVNLMPTDDPVRS